MLDYRFERISRTTSSEQYQIETPQHAVGRVDLHYTNAKVYATLAVHVSLPEEELEDLISAIDDRLVASADEFREDFIVTVWRGDEVGTFSEDFSRGDLEDRDLDELDDGAFDETHERAL